MHEGVVVSVGEGQVVEYLVLGADSVGLLTAGWTVIPGEGHCTPTIMVVNRQDETAVENNLAILESNFRKIFH